MPQYGTQSCNSFYCTAAGVVGIPTGETMSPSISLPACTYFDADPPSASGVPSARSTVVLFCPADPDTATASLTIGATVIPDHPVLSSPDSKWNPYLSYAVGATVYAQATASVPFYGYTCIAAVSKPSGTSTNPTPATDSTHWSQFSTVFDSSANNYIVPWSKTAAYTPSDTYVLSKGFVYYCDSSVSASPSGNADPSIDTAHWILATQSFKIFSASAATGAGFKYCYQVMNAPEFTY